MLSEAMTSFWQ